MNKIHVVLILLIVTALACGSGGSATITTPATDTPRAGDPETAAPTDTREPQDTAAPLATSAALPIGVVGDRVESAGVAVTVKGVSQTGELQSFLTPEEGNVYVVIDVLVENAREGEDVPYNPLYFVVKDSDGFEYSSTLIAPDPSLSAGDLVPGDRVRGNVAFEVAETATGLIVSFEPLVIFGDYQPIRFNVGDVAGMSEN